MQSLNLSAINATQNTDAFLHPENRWNEPSPVLHTHIHTDTSKEDTPKDKEVGSPLLLSLLKRI